MYILYSKCKVASRWGGVFAVQVRLYFLNYPCKTGTVIIQVQSLLQFILPLKLYLSPHFVGSVSQYIRPISNLAVHANKYDKHLKNIDCSHKPPLVSCSDLQSPLVIFSPLTTFSNMEKRCLHAMNRNGK